MRNEQVVLLCTFSLFLAAVFFGCQPNKIEAVQKRTELAEPDETLRIDNEVMMSLAMVSKEAKNSVHITISKHGQKLINSGEAILPYLMLSFTDTASTSVFSNRNNRNSTFGELGIIIASEIKPIPIAKVVGVQQCVPPFDFEIESYLPRIQENPSEFIRKYKSWLLEVNATETDRFE